MKHYNFNKIIPREHTCSIKYDHEKADCCLPMWIADMDFPVADEIMVALRQRARHPIFGYTHLPDELIGSLLAWQANRHGVDYRREYVIPYYSVVAAIDLILHNFTEPGDAVTIMSPVYMYFWHAIRETGRRIEVSPLLNTDNHYEIDFENLDKCLAKSKVLLLCSPHNPAGRVWTENELTKMAVLAAKHHVLVIDDEIHSDIVMPGHKHIPFLQVAGACKDTTITLLSSTKTFNLAQAGMSFIVAGNAEQAEKIRTAMQCYHLGSQNLFAAVMVQAAFEHGADWVDQVTDYIHGNYQLIQAVLAEKMPKIKILPLEGTYLIWVDCRAMKCSVVELFENQAHILGEDGVLFGDEGAGYYRINIASPRKMIKEMLKRLEIAYHHCEK